MEWSTGRAPLGAMFEGQCEQNGPGEGRLCNFGYARGVCGHFPEGSIADAIRFSVVGKKRGAVQIVWVLERDHAPVEHGLLEYRGGEFVEMPQGVIAVQARIFIENYLSR
jgi:hypothetical protein